MSNTLYTPLEILCLTQALRSQPGITFKQLAEQLVAVPAIRNDPSYVEDRLRSDALRELYLGLVKDEAKRDLEREAQTSGLVPKGEQSPTSRKRKVTSPTPATVHDAAGSSHLVPQLVDRLYARYRETIVERIRSHEREWDALSRDTAVPEAGQTQELGQDAQTSAVLESSRPVLTVSAISKPVVPLPEKSTPSNSNSPATVQPAQVPFKPYTQAKIDAVMNHDPEPQRSTPSHSRNTSITTLPSLSEMAPQSPRFGIPPKLPAHMPLHLHQQPSNNGYAYSPPSTHHQSYSPLQARPIQGQQVQQLHSRPLSSPRPILPPPPGMQLPPPNSSRHLSSPHLHNAPIPAQPHFQAPHRMSIGSPSTGDNPFNNYVQPQLQQPQAYYQHSTYQDPRNQYTSPAPPAHAGYSQPAQYGNARMQPTPYDSQQANVQSRHQPLVQPVPAPRSPYPTTSAESSGTHPMYHSAPPTSARPPPQPSQRVLSDIVNALATPSQSHRKRLWKNERRALSLRVPAVPDRPAVEPLSPLMRRASPTTRPSNALRSTETPVGNDAFKVKLGSKPRKSQARTVKELSPHSTASSTADGSRHGRTRSQSVSAIGAAPTLPAKSGRKKRDVKPEPSTPAPNPKAIESSVEPPATSASGPMTRKRRGTIRAQPQPQSKRKRQPSLSTSAPDGAETNPTPPPRRSTVMVTRNFAKMAATVMNDITSHKHASYFAGPVSDKSAAGYSEIIKRPQHLKAIRAAITAGTRAMAAASTTTNSPSASASKIADGSTTFELERTAELVPPKAIVNGEQLEKEVYRMFANAVMFNPGEDGLVSDTREMFEDVEAKIGDWRGAEREPDESTDGKTKRRKL